MIYIPIKTIKDKVFSEMKLAIYQDEINEDNETINDIGTNNISKPTTDNTNQTESSPSQPKKNISYTYIGQLSIPKIRFKRGFVKKESKYNNIEYNVTIAKEADYPDVKNGNFILMAHSGDAYISYFAYLYKLNVGDQAIVTYKDHKYTYQIEDISKQAKTGTLTIKRNKTKTTLTLITCTNNDSTTQTIYVASLVNVS